MQFWYVQQIAYKLGVIQSLEFEALLHLRVT
jgi:hypothetical protein